MKLPKIWEGVYQTYSDASKEVNKYSNIFLGDSWYQHQKNMLIKVLSDSMPRVAPLLMPYICGLDTKRLSIIDFGGGIGLDYYRITQHTKCVIDNYTVIENEALVNLLTSDKQGDEILKFFSDFPIKKYDIFYSVNSIHYLVDPLDSLINIIQNTQPSSVILGGVLLSTLDQFFTNQFRGNLAATVCFIELNQLVTQLKKLGYDLIYNIKTINSYDGMIQEIPSHNLPPKYRDIDKRDLIFRRQF